MDDFTRLSALAMADAIRRKEFSALELVDAHLSRIDKLNPQLNAFVHVDPESARRDARAADWAVKQHAGLGALNGVPISIKSSIDVAGFRCEAGTKLRAGYIASHDAPLVARLRRAGAVILGVTNSPELLMAWETDNLLYGRTNNPWDLSRTAGGSSGGESAAIASCCSAGGVGSDGGGSIRVPAHFTGICGLKPTSGRIPATGHFPSSVGPFALIGVVGPMARTVADLRTLFEVMQGYDEGDTCAAPIAVRHIASNDLKKIQIGYFEEDGRTPVTPETSAAVHTAALGLQRAGCKVSPFLLQGLDEARQLWWKFFGTAGAMLLDPMTAGHEAELSPILKQFMSWTAAEPPHTAESLLNAWVQRDVVRTQIFAQMKEIPILICPVAAVPAFRHGERSWTINGSTVQYLDAWSYCEWFNLLGMPAAVVPIAPSKEGLPIGVQIVGQPWQEELVLAVAELVEKECGGWREPPLKL
jgi:Asp-tRNA(Asn)/Glu-tRNA(Gln) amidotransferase A subunit family amidase